MIMDREAPVSQREGCLKVNEGVMAKLRILSSPRSLIVGESEQCVGGVFLVDNSSRG